MTDDLMDARLRAAGERWRAANTASTTTLATAGKDAGIELPVSGPPHRARRWGLIASAAAVVAALVAGGSWLLAGSSGHGSHRAADGAAITGTVWELSGTLQFSIGADSRFVGHDECFTATGTAEVSNSTITVPHPRVRAKECTDQYGTTLRDLLKVLRNPTGYTITAGQLVFDNGSAGAFRFAPLRVITPDSTKLVTTRWRLTNVVEGDGTSVAAPRRLALRITTYGSLVADDGLNTVNADVKIRTDSVELSQVLSTAVGSTKYDPIRDTVDAVLTGAVRYSISGNRLTLTKPGAGTLTYVAGNAADKLLGYSWKLTSIRSGSGPAEPPSAGVIFSFEAKGLVYDHLGDNSDVTDIRSNRLTFDQPWINDLMIHPGPRLDTGEAGLVYDAILQGEVHWRTAGDRLIITKPHIGAVTLQRHGMATAGPGNGGTPSATPTR